MRRLMPTISYRLRFQILAPLIILFSVVASSSLIVIIQLQERLQESERQSLINSKINKAIFSFDQIRSSMKTDILAYLLTSNNNLKKSIKSLELLRKTEEPTFYKALRERPDFEDDFRQLEKTYLKTSILRNRIIEAVDVKDSKRALDYFNSYSLVFEINSARLIDLRNRLETEAAINRNETNEFFNWLLVFMVSILVFGTAVILFSLRYYNENLISPIKRLKEGLHEIQEGRFPIIDKSSRASIEIEGIVDDFNETAINLRSIKEELVTSNENALQLAKIKSDFLSNMSHEIRTPLNSIIGMSELLKDFKHEKEVEEHLKTIINSGNLLLNIVNDILDLSKLENGTIQLDPEPCDINELAGLVKSSFAHLFKEKSLSFSIEISPKTPQFILADCNRLEQIILNLLSNAYKFTPAGGVKLKVLPVNDSDSKMLAFIVEDTGIGIQKNMQDQLFTRFNQGDSSITKQYGGTGLGLSIVKDLIELMHGEVKIESTPGKGSIFTVQVPLVEVSHESFKNSKKLVELSQQKLNTFDKPPKVLLVDDSKENRKVVTLFLKSLNIEIDEAQNGVEAIDAFNKNDYELILMDMQMPILDGHSATKRIREIELSEGKKRTPIIALTAFVMQDEVDKSKLVGCDEHLSKPIKRDLLIDNVIKYLNQS